MFTLSAIISKWVIYYNFIPCEVRNCEDIHFFFICTLFYARLGWNLPYFRHIAMHALSLRFTWNNIFRENILAPSTDLSRILLKFACISVIFVVLLIQIAQFTYNMIIESIICLKSLLNLLILIYFKCILTNFYNNCLT